MSRSRFGKADGRQGHCRHHQRRRRSGCAQVTATGEQTALAGIMRLVNEGATEQIRHATAGRPCRRLALLHCAGGGGADGHGLDRRRRFQLARRGARGHGAGHRLPARIRGWPCRWSSPSATSLAARNGILVRNRLALEEARLLDTVVFDKTGTLTTGQQGLAGMAVAGALDEDVALALAAAAEGDSEHVVARAIRTGSG